MSDLLLEISKNPNARKIVKRLGLPIPLPENLKRAKGPWEERPLQDEDVVVGAYAGGSLLDTLAATLGEAGANPILVGDDETMRPFRAPGEAFGRPPRRLAPGEEPGQGLRPHALVFDATRIDEPAKLRALYDFFHPILPSLA